MNATTRWSPQEPYSLLSRFLDDYMRRAPARADGGEEEMVQSTWTPPVDVKETAAALTLYIELAGLTKDDIEISLEQNVLTVTGERRFGEGEKREDFHRIERVYGKFSRSFRLPRDVDGTGVTANFKDGVLTLQLPKAEAAKPRQIKIS